MTELFQHKVDALISAYYSEQDLHRSNIEKAASDRDFAKSKARNQFSRDERRIADMKQSVEANRQRIIDEAEQNFQQKLLAARQQMAANLMSATTRKRDLEILKKKMPTDFQTVKAAPLESVTIPDSDNVYLDLLNTMNAYENASLLRRPDMKLRANKAAATFNAMIQAEMLSIEKAERAAKEDLNLPAMQQEHQAELELKLSQLEDCNENEADRTALIEAERNADAIYDQRVKTENDRHSQQPDFEEIRHQCLDLIEEELTTLKLDKAFLANPYEVKKESELTNALFNIVLDEKGFKLDIPYLSTWEAPEHLWFYVDDEDVQETVLDGFRALVGESLRRLSFGNLRVYWFDPSQQGMTIKELAMLANDLPGCEPVVKLVTTGAQVNTLLSEIEELQATIGEQIAPYRGGIKEYNSVNPQNQIPYTLIVVNDITHPSYDSRAVGLLQQRMRNASKMGMQTLVLSDAYEIGGREGEALDTMRDTFFRTVAEVKGGELFTQQSNGELAQIKVLGREFADAAFIQSYIEACKEIANRPSDEPEIISNENLDEVPAYPIKEGIEIPVGFYEDGSVATLRFGSVVGGEYAEHTHGIITGGTGTGKTSFVRNLIQSACSHYTPDELELWLVDYKAEMTSFCNSNCRFPHFGMIGLDRSTDFVAGFMNYLKKENERRTLIIGEPSGMGLLRRDDISDYNEWAIANGRPTLPRLLVIIDEFHVQANLMKHEPIWREEFEGLLREVRSRGINILLVDQDISGLSAGLTESGQAQLSFRATLGVNAGRAGDLRALFGNASNFSDTADMAASLKYQALLYDKTSNRVKLVAQTRNCDWDSIAQAVCRAREKSPGQGHDTKIYNVHDIEGMALGDIRPTEEELYPVGTVPDFVKPAFEIQLRNRNRQNVFAIGTSDPLLPFNIISLMAYTAWKHHGYRVVVLGIEDCDLFDETYDAWYELSEEYMDDELEIYEDIASINGFFDNMDQLENVFVVMVGFDDLYEEMKELPERAANQVKEKPKETVADRTRKLAALWAGEPVEEDESAEDEHSSEELNDMGNIYKLLTESKARNVHVAVLEDSVPRFERIFHDQRRKDFDKLFPHAFATKPASMSDGIPINMRAVGRSMEDSETAVKAIYSDPNSKCRSVSVYDVPWNSTLKG